MVRISKNNLSLELQRELDRLSTIGDLIGGVNTFENLPATNTGVTGSGLSIIPTVTKIKTHDLIIVTDARGDNKGSNAIFEAVTTGGDGDAVTWTFVMNMSIPTLKRVLVSSSNVPDVLDGEVTVGEDVKNIYDTDEDRLELYVNGLFESGFTIDDNNTLELTGYTTTGWTADDTVKFYAWKET
jgi:hypothetical protein